MSPEALTHKGPSSFHWLVAGAAPGGAADKGLLLGSEKEPTAKTHSTTEPQETLCKGEETRDTEDYLL